jgi:TonB-dependent receptor
VLSLTPEEIFVPGNINPGDFQFEEITRQTDNYLADQKVVGGYLMTDLPLGLGFRLVGGIRVEHSSQHVKTFELFNPDNEPVVSDLATTDLLPAAAVSWDFSEDMLVRLGAARTLSRPDFRELSPATFNDVTGGRQVYGNPELERAAINNLDLRWEWYLEAGESLSLGVFYKRFEQPIETIVVVSAQHSVTYENAEGADNLGIELEFRKGFGFLDKMLQDFYLAGNATWVYSSIDLPEEGIQTSSSRPLQGQSPYVLNFQLGYDNVESGTSVVVLYNVFGKRIAEVGALGAPDVYEQPFHQLDLVIKQDLGGGFSMGFKAKNLVDPGVRFTQGDQTTETFRRGRSFSLGLEKSF